VLRDSSLVVHGRNIQRVPASPVLAAQALRAAVQGLVQGRDLVDRAQVDLARRVREAPVGLLRPEKLHAHSVPRIIAVVAVASSIRRPRKAR